MRISEGLQKSEPGNSYFCFLSLSHSNGKRKTIFVLYPHTYTQYERIFYEAKVSSSIPAVQGNTHHDPSRVHKYLDKDSHNTLQQQILYMLVCSSHPRCCFLCFLLCRLDWIECDYHSLRFYSCALLALSTSPREKGRNVKGNIFIF